jgi:hypothetical protein
MAGVIAAVSSFVTRLDLIENGSTHVLESPFAFYSAGRRHSRAPHVMFPRLREKTFRRRAGGIVAGTAP